MSARLRLLKKRLQRDEVLLVIDELVGIGDTVVDIGAHRGVCSLVMAKRVGPAGSVHAFEPFPSNVVALRGLQAIRPNLSVHPVALSDRRGSVSFHVPVVNGRFIDALGSTRLPAAEHVTVEVERATLDELLPLEQPVSFIKCDVEGEEQAVLAGAAALLEAHRPTLVVEMEERHRPGTVAATTDFLSRFGYVGYFLRGPDVVPLEEFDLEACQLRFLDGGPVFGGMPAGYVNNFLFRSPDRP